MADLNIRYQEMAAISHSPVDYIMVSSTVSFNFPPPTPQNTPFILAKEREWSKIRAEFGHLGRMYDHSWPMFN